jgi:DNA-binding NarL/FixJ family response regulator
MIYLYSQDASIRSRWQEALVGRVDVQSMPEDQPLAAALAAVTEGLVLADLAADDLVQEGRLVELCRVHSGKRIVAAYTTLSPADAIALFGAGARGYCNRLIRPELLVEVIRVVEHGEVWVGEQLMSGLLRALPRAVNSIASDDPLLVPLTDREKDVIPFIVDGMANKVIARELDITERTVKAHVSSILRKLGVSDRMQLAMLLTRPEKQL